MLEGARVFHVNVNCSDLEAARRFWCDGVGFTVGARTTPVAPQPGASFGLDTAHWDADILVGDHGFGGGAVDSLQWLEPAPVLRPIEHLTTCGLNRLGVFVPDLAAATAAVAQHGGVVWGAPVLHDDEHATVNLAFTSDPDGTIVELIEGGGPRLMFAGITCADLAASIAWYERLGFTQLLRVASERPDAAHLRIDGAVAMHEVIMVPPGRGDVTVMLTGFDQPSVAPSARRPANALGPWRITLAVADLDVVLADLASVGVAVHSEAATLDMGPGLPPVRFVCCSGPDGEVLEFIETPT